MSAILPSFVNNTYRRDIAEKLLKMLFYRRNPTITYTSKKEQNIFLIRDHVLDEEFEDTKGVIRISKSKKDRQHNGQNKRYKRTNNYLQNIHLD